MELDAPTSLKKSEIKNEILFQAQKADRSRKEEALRYGQNPGSILPEMRGVGFSRWTLSTYPNPRGARG